MTFGQGQDMTLTFNTHNTSLAQHGVCIYQPQATKLPEKFNVFTFFIEKPMEPKLTLS